MSHRLATADSELHEGDVVLISELDPTYLHLLRLRPLEEATNLSFDATVKRNQGHVPSKWVAQCGIRGGTWHYREGVFGARRVCPGCIREGLAEARAA